jgi:hypothetical protein
MKKFGLIFVLVVFCFADVYPIRGKDTDNIVKNPMPMPLHNRGTLIDSVGDIRATMGSSGKGICVSEYGNAIAVCYGRPSYDTNNSMLVMVAYSTDGGATFTTYGPYSSASRRIYAAVDGTADFDAQPGELFHSWQYTVQGYDVGDHLVMIEENIPSSPSPSVPISLTSNPAFCPWNSSIAVSPDIPGHVVATDHHLYNNGNENMYAYISTDGGYSWTDTINVSDTVVGDAGHVDMGTGGYVFATMHLDSLVDGYNVLTPYYNESTDGGFTWAGPEMLPVPYLDSVSSFWWQIRCYGDQ